MQARRLIAACGLMAAFAAISETAQAETIRLQAGSSLQAAISAASPGDTIVLAGGQHSGPVTIDRTLTLEGESGATIEGNGAGNVVTVTAPDTVVRGLKVTRSGRVLAEKNSGIYLAPTATRSRVENNELVENAYGVVIQGAHDATVQGNRITGRSNGRLSETGDGVAVWNAPGARVLDNDITFGRDAISTMTSKENVFRGNRMSRLRFAIHYMYTNDSEVSDNISTGNAAGFVMMYSSRLKITDNVSDGDRDYGLLLNYANDADVHGNAIHGRLLDPTRWMTAGTPSAEHGGPAGEKTASVAAGDLRLGPEKCVFIYNAYRNVLTDNLFEGCAIGIHFTAGSEGNTIVGNSFIANRNQVKYVSTRYLDWSVNGRGNYWSDNPAFDLDGDGIGDNPYRPNDLVDRVLWTSPQAKVLTTSPAVQVIRWAQTRFPALLPGGVVDSHPLMEPPVPGKQGQ